MMRKALPLILAVLVLASGTAAAGVYEDMMNAIAIDDRATVEALLRKGVDPDTVSPKGDPLVMLAVREGKLDVLRAILAHRPRVNARNALGETALMLAAIRGRMDMVKLLLDQGAVVNQPGWTPLIYAAAGNQLDIARLLIERGADLNAAAENGTTALMMAAREGGAAAHGERRGREPPVAVRLDRSRRRGIAQPQGRGGHPDAGWRGTLTAVRSPASV
jgi:hypothetical protein